MGKIGLRYYSVIKGRGYWQPTAAMRALGFKPTPCGPDGPAAWKIAEDLNAAWDARGAAPAVVIPKVETYPAGSIGEAFSRYRSTHEWAKKAVRTREDWERAWKYIRFAFGDAAPSEVTMERISVWRQKVEDEISLREAHRALKIWRALWKVMAALKYCDRDRDPSLAVRNTEPKGRRATWSEGEAVRLVKRAWRMGYRGFAVALACLWDGAVAPVDARTLKLSQMRQDSEGVWFDIQRGKTGRDGVLTLSRRSERLFRPPLRQRRGRCRRRRGHHPLGKTGQFAQPVEEAGADLCACAGDDGPPGRRGAPDRTKSHEEVGREKFKVSPFVRCFSVVILSS